jgi:phosphoenolpyruvate synthase/pyruvate phosphate dikinase
MIKFFEDITDDELLIVGGKGMSLAKMINGWFNVPPGFVLTTDAFNQDKSIWWDDVLYAFDQLDCQYVAVRSSGTKEDGLDDSFAGQFDTYLYVDRDHLIAKIQDCHDSIKWERLQEYCISKDIDIHSIKVAVVIQKMVNSEVAGVWFSVHPVTQDTNTIIIEWAYGLWEAVVSGAVTPDSYLVDKITRKITQKYISTQTTQLIRGVTGGNERVNIPLPDQTLQKMSDIHILELAEIIIQLEQFYGLPVDTEWALENSVIYMTQSRPITTLHSWSDSLVKLSIPEFIYHVDLIGSRPSNIQRDECMKLFMYNYNNTEFVTIPIDHTNRGYYYEKDKFHTYLEEWKNTLLTYEGYRNYLLEYSKIKERVSQFVVQDKLSKHEIKQKFYERYELISSMTPYIMCSVGTEDFLDPLCRDLLQQYYPDRVDGIFDVIANPTELTEYQMMMKKIYEIKLWLHQHSILQLVDDYYRYPEYRFTEELYTEQYFQNILDNLTFEYAQYEYNKLIALLSENKKRFLKTVDSVQDHPNVQHLLEVINTNIWLRTDRVDTFKKWQPQIRKLYSQIVSFLHQEGKLNYTYDDILWMTNDEVYNYLNHNDIVSYKIIQKRKTNECVMIYDWKRVYIDLDKENIQSIKNIILWEYTSEIKGMVSYPGNVQGRVQIVRSREDLSLVMQGDILVAKTTFVEYTPAMKVAWAIVTDEGWITSHAAIVSRELKKPCIVWCKKAVDALCTWDIIAVDANNGVVRIIEKNIQCDDIIDKIIYTSWKKNRAWSWSFVSAYYLWYQYTKQLKDQIDIWLEQTLIITKNGISSCYFTQESKDAFGQYFAQQANDNPSIIWQRCEDLIKATDEALSSIIILLEQEISKENFEKYIEVMYAYGVPHRIVKMSTDYINIFVLQNYLWQLEHARIYAEPVYEMTEKYMHYIAEQLAYRYEIPKNFILWMTKEQFEDLLYRWICTIDQNILSHQYDSWIMYIQNGLPYYFFWEQVYDIEQKLLNPEMKTLSWQIAYKGKITGEVRIILDANKFLLDDFEEWYILVTWMTRPEYLPLLKKCSAFVTDAGGVLSHAAIVARELKKPCIIWTEISTKILKDWDVVEVDAYNGIISIIS